MRPGPAVPARLKKGIAYQPEGRYVIWQQDPRSPRRASGPGRERRWPAVCPFRGGRHWLRTRQAAAAADFCQALSLWHGAALADLSYEPFAQAEIARLEDLRADVVEDRIEAELALGHHADVVGEFLGRWLPRARCVSGRRGPLMVALYRCGRQPEALAACQSGRGALVEELDIEPSPALQHVERAILSQDAWLDRAPRRTARCARPG